MSWSGQNIANLHNTSSLIVEPEIPDHQSDNTRNRKNKYNKTTSGRTGATGTGTSFRSACPKSFNKTMCGGSGDDDDDELDELDQMFKKYQKTTGAQRRYTESELESINYSEY